jgi:hypothetical protein
MNRSRQRDEVVAYYESGHVIIVNCEDIPIHRVTLEPGENHDGLTKMGRFLIANADCDDITPRRRDRLERFVRVMLAGNIAQHRFKPRSGYREFNLHADRHKAVELLSHFTRSNEELGAYLRLLQIQTKQKIEGRWPLVEAVANALLDRRTLSRDEVRTIVLATIRIPTPRR